MSDITREIKSNELRIYCRRSAQTDTLGCGVVTKASFSSSFDVQLDLIGTSGEGFGYGSFCIIPANLVPQSSADILVCFNWNVGGVYNIIIQGQTAPVHSGTLDVGGAPDTFRIVGKIGEQIDFYHNGNWLLRYGPWQPNTNSFRVGFTSLPGGTVGESRETLFDNFKLVAESAPYNPGGFEVTNLKLNGNGSSVVVEPSATVNIEFDWTLWNADNCPGCLRQLIIGLENQVLSCIHSSVVGKFPGKSGHAKKTFKAPSTTGNYSLMAVDDVASSCTQAVRNYKNKSGKKAIGSVSVQQSQVNDSPPTVNITVPQDGATVSGSVTISTVFSDDRGLSRYRILVNDVVFSSDRLDRNGTVTSAEKSIGWDTTFKDSQGNPVYPDGTYTIRVEVFDSSGQQSSKTIAVRVQNGAISTSGVVTFTFDDGFKNQFDNAYPVMRQRGFKGVVFMITGLVGDWFEGRQMMSLSNLQTLRADGWEIGSHTVSHPCLTLTDPCTPGGSSKLDSTALDAELRESKNWLTNNGFSVTAFAYPYGAYNSSIAAAVGTYYRYGRIAYPDGLNDTASTNTTLMACNLREDTVETCKDYARQAKEQNKWLVVMVHGIVNSSSELPSNNTLFSWITEQLPPGRR